MSRLEKVIKRKGKTFLFRVEESADQRDYPRYETLRNEIWEWAEDPLAGSRNMMCENFFHDGSSLFIGVFTEKEAESAGPGGTELVGFAYGFVGVKDKHIGFRSLDNLQFYSQYTGVKPAYERFGLGNPIKEFQREAVTQLLGVYTATCTYDPLSGVNAYRNIHYFGMDVLDYSVGIYGEFGGRLNRVDIPRDRFTMSWDLKRDVKNPFCDVEALLRNRQMVTWVERVTVPGRSGPIEMDVLQRTDLDRDHDFLLVEIPFDFYRMLQETDVEDDDVRSIPLTWRLKTREAFRALFEKGYRVTGFSAVEIEGRTRDFYVLRRRFE